MTIKRMTRSILFLVLSLLLPFSATASEPVDFQLPDIQGNDRKLSEFRGKWVVVNYWATWCPPCLDELPELEMFHNAHKDTDAVVLGVNLEEISLEKLKTFVEGQFISYPILLDEPGVSTALGRVTGLPTSYLVNPRGVVVARQVGPVDKAMLDSYIETYNNKQSD